MTTVSLKYVLYSPLNSTTYPFIQAQASGDNYNDYQEDMDNIIYDWSEKHSIKRHNLNKQFADIQRQMDDIETEYHNTFRWYQKIFHLNEYFEMRSRIQFLQREIKNITYELNMLNIEHKSTVKAYYDITRYLTQNNFYRKQSVRLENPNFYLEIWFKK